MTFKTRKSIWTIFHLLIIINFLVEIAYASFMVFSVLSPPGIEGPLMTAALTVPFEQMVTRRLYAIECWIAIAGLAIYLAITELGPRLNRGPAD